MLIRLGKMIFIDYNAITYKNYNISHSHFKNSCISIHEILVIFVCVTITETIKHLVLICGKKTIKSFYLETTTGLQILPLSLLMRNPLKLI